jgi:hypothetical protein
MAVDIELRRGKASQPSGLITLEPQLQRDLSNWNGNTAADINDPPSDYFDGMGGPNGTFIVTNSAYKPKKFAGGLVSHKRLPPRDANGNLYQIVAMRVGFMWSKYVDRLIARLEIDLKICFKTRPNSNTKIRNVANCSTQWNRDKQEWQIDEDPPKWIGSGYKVTDAMMQPDIPHVVDFRFWYDPEAAIFSVTSIDLDDNPYSVSEDLQRVAAQNTNWEEVRSVQLQTEIYEPGSASVNFFLVQLGWSHDPIPVGAW